MLSCGKHCATMQVGTVSGVWRCRRSWKLKIDLWGNFVHIWKSYVCSSKLDVCDAGPRMDGVPALDLWDLVIEVLHSSSNQPKKSKENVQGNLLHDTPSRKHTKNQVKTPIQHNDLELCNVDYVSSNVKSSQIGAMLYIFEDNERVIKMIIKGRSPKLSHVPKNPNHTCWHQKPTHRHIDQGQFHSWWMESSSPFVQRQHLNVFILPTSYPQTMSKKLIQEGTPGEDERVVAKSKLARNPVSTSLNRSPSSLSSRTSQRLGNLTGKCSTWDSFGTGKPVAMDSNDDKASGSQVWQSDGNLNSSTGIRDGFCHSCELCSQICLVVFFGLESEKKWCGTHTYKPNGKWDRVAEDTMLNFCECGHPVFRRSSVLERGGLKSKRKGNNVFISVLTTTPPNWFFAQCIHWAVSDMCDELACRIFGCSESAEKLVAQINSETVVVPTQLSTANKTSRTNDKVQGDLLHEDEQKMGKSSRSSSVDQIVLLCRYHEDPSTMQNWKNRRGGEGGVSCQEYTLRHRSIQRKRMHPWEHEDRSSFGGGSQSPSRPLRNRDHAMELVLGWWPRME